MLRNLERGCRISISDENGLERVWVWEEWLNRQKYRRGNLVFIDSPKTDDRDF